MEFLYTKALHIIFVVTWFAGLFYIVRLFIYHAEAESKDDTSRRILQTQYKLMEKRLWYIITWPSAILASSFAFYMLYLTNFAYLTQTWMWVKLSFVFLLYIYHIICHRIFKQLQNNIVKYSAIQLRIWNEVATIILFAVVFLVVLQNSIGWIWGVIGIFLFSIILMLLVKLYKRIRQKRNWENTTQTPENTI